MTAPHGTLALEIDDATTLALPAGLVGTERSLWLIGAIDHARRASSHWISPLTSLVPDIVEHALARRGDDGVVLLHWPAIADVFAVLRVSTLPSKGVTAIADELRAHRGARVEHFAGASLGPGAEWVYDDVLPGMEGEASEASKVYGAQFCFTDDEITVLASLDPMLPGHFSAALEEVRGLVRTIELERDGAAWRAAELPDDVGTRPDDESWPEPGARSAG